MPSATDVRAALVVAAKELRLRARDRSMLLVCFLGPFVLTVIMSSALPNQPLPRVAVGLVDLDGGAAGRALGDALGSERLGDVLSVRHIADEGGAQAALRDGTVDAVMILPPGLTDGLTTGVVPALRVLRRPDRHVEAVITQAVGLELAGQFFGLARAAETVRVFTPSPDVHALAARALAGVQLGSVRDRAIGDAGIKAASYFGPAMAIVFLFFGIGSVARQLPLERREGTLRRIASAPVAASSVILGKALAGAAVGTVQMAAMWGASVVFLGATWGDTLGVALLIVGLVLAVLGIVGLVATAAHTDAQADALSSMVAFVLALLGGNFIQAGDLPDGLRSVSALTPNGWALRGFTDLVAFDSGAGSIAAPLVVVFGFAAATIAVAVRRSARIGLL